MEEQEPTRQPLPEAREGQRHFPSAKEDALHTRLDPETPQTRSPAYKLGFADPDFLLRDELRPARLELEYLKPEILQRDRGITSTVVVFGSARIPSPEQATSLVAEAARAVAENPGDPHAAHKERTARALAEKSGFYDEARRLGQLVSGKRGDRTDVEACELPRSPYKVVVVTGGGPGIMEAANRGAHDAGADSIGLNIVLPFEQKPNEYISPHLCFNFHYFALRKMHFMMRAKALVAFPGGFGTFDELFEVLCLIQTGKIKPIPVLLFGRKYWERVIDFAGLVDEGVIEPDDLEIFSYVETAEEAWQLLEPVLSATCRHN
jgi:uncharacterized protein (TIGR00730 family)